MGERGDFLRLLLAAAASCSSSSTLCFAWINISCVDSNSSCKATQEAHEEEEEEEEECDNEAQLPRGLLGLTSQTLMLLLWLLLWLLLLLLILLRRRGRLGGRG